MRKKYNKFDVSKINNKTIEIALNLKNDLSETKDLKAAFLKNSDVHIPKNQEKLLEYLSVKYLSLIPEDGVPILRQALQQQYSIEDEFKLCRYCNKPFRFERSNSVFCSNRCRQRFNRSKRV